MGFGGVRFEFGDPLHSAGKKLVAPFRIGGAVHRDAAHNPNQRRTSIAKVKWLICGPNSWTISGQLTLGVVIGQYG